MCGPKVDNLIYSKMLEFRTLILLLFLELHKLLRIRLGSQIHSTQCGHNMSNLCHYRMCGQFLKKFNILQRYKMQSNLFTKRLLYAEDIFIQKLHIGLVVTRSKLFASKVIIRSFFWSIDCKPAKHCIQIKSCQFRLELEVEQATGSIYTPEVDQ